jgi:hypothetical protein
LGFGRLWHEAVGDGFIVVADGDVAIAFGLGDLAMGPYRANPSMALLVIGCLAL